MRHELARVRIGRGVICGNGALLGQRPEIGGVIRGCQLHARGVPAGVLLIEIHAANFRPLIVVKPDACPRDFQRVGRQFGDGASGTFKPRAEQLGTARMLGEHGVLPAQPVHRRPQRLLGREAGGDVDPDAEHAGLALDHEARSGDVKGEAPPVL